MKRSRFSEETDRRNIEGARGWRLGCGFGPQSRRQRCQHLHPPVWPIAAVEEMTREWVPLQWAEAQNGLRQANALLKGGAKMMFVQNSRLSHKGSAP